MMRVRTRAGDGADTIRDFFVDAPEDKICLAGTDLNARREAREENPERMIGRALTLDEAGALLDRLA